MVRAFAGTAMVLAAGLASAQTTSDAKQGSGDLVAPKVFRTDAAASRVLPNGTKSTSVLLGSLATGEAIEAHESVQPAGADVVLHVINHSELILVKEGTVSFDHDGKSETVKPGEVIYVAYGTNHRVRNVGSTPARYLVISISGDVKK